MRSHRRQAAPRNDFFGAESTQPVLAIEGLTKSYGGVTALDDLRLEIETGRSLCLIGPNGCGKTSLLRAISGEIRPQCGTVEFLGRNLLGLAPHQIARLGIARKFQSPSIIETLTVQDNLALAQAARGMPADDEQIRHWLSRVKLDGLSARIASELAHGQKQWLEISMLMVQDPKLLLLDEPTAGLTTSETRATVDLIEDLMATHDLSIIVIEHDLRFVSALDIETAVMMHGRIVRRGRYQQVRQDPFVREIYLGSRA